MIPAWTDEDLRCLARDHRNDPDVLDLIAGVRRVLALCERDWYAFPSSVIPLDDDGTAPRFVAVADLLAALNDPNGAMS